MKTGSRRSSVAFRICHWNINGRWMFFKDENIARWITQFDIVFLTETHFTKGQTFDLPNYKSYHNAFSDVNDRKARWGISCFIANKAMPYVLNVDRTFDNHIMVTLKEGHRLFGSYIPRLIRFITRTSTFMQFQHLYHQLIMREFLLAVGI